MARPRSPEHRVKHGERAGYHWHIRQGEPPCDKCRAWCREDARQYRKRKREERGKLRIILSRGTSGKERYSLTNTELDVTMKVLRKTATAEELKELGLD